MANQKLSALLHFLLTEQTSCETWLMVHGCSMGKKSHYCPPVCFFGPGQISFQNQQPHSAIPSQVSMTEIKPTQVLPWFPLTWKDRIEVIQIWLATHRALRPSDVLDNAWKPVLVEGNEQEQALVSGRQERKKRSLLEMSMNCKNAKLRWFMATPRDVVVLKLQKPLYCKVRRPAVVRSNPRDGVSSRRLSQVLPT